MKIEKNKVVELIYELEVDGSVVDHTVEERPLDFIAGTGALLEKFEENIAGLEPGEPFSFTLTPEEGYGEKDPERVIELPKAAFEIDGVMRDDLMKVGNTIPLVNGMGGVVPGVILAIGDATVTIDINHPMAGKTLNFSGKILSVRSATGKELEEGLHGEKVHQCHHCGGHKGGCHGGGCHGGEGHCHEDGEGGCHGGEGHCHKDGEGCCGGNCHQD